MSIAGNGIFIVPAASNRLPQWQKYKVLVPIRQKAKPAETLFDDLEQCRGRWRTPLNGER